LKTAITNFRAYMELAVKEWEDVIEHMDSEQDPEEEAVRMGQFVLTDTISNLLKTYADIDPSLKFFLEWPEHTSEY